tara:strand:- start:58 stop:1845 length:1788 start_codon:yes stop_codon:yes gene_type:complete
MTHSRENKTTRWRWQQFVLSLSVAMWTFVDSPTALLAQETTKYPTLPTGSGINQDLWKTWHSKNAEGSASYNIARVYHDDFVSNNKQRSAENAFKYYDSSANTGYARAQANLGYCHDIGLGTEKNLAKAKRWYGEAAKQGNLVGQLNYAQKLLNEGIGTKNRDSILKARSWFEKALAQNARLKEAAYGIGLSYVKIPGAKEEDLGTARNWLLKAENHPKALFALGYLDEQQGRYGTAIELYKQAKAHGSLAAAYNLGRCREIGRGTVENKQEAMNEYLFAANRGHAMSQFAIGLLEYNQGNNTSDYIEAVKWWRLAEKNGSSQAREALSKIKQSRLLTKEEIAIGESDASRLEETIRSDLKPHKSAKLAYNQEQAFLSDKDAEHVISGFFITNDGWILTSGDRFQIDPKTKKVAIGYSVMVVTQAGSFPVNSEIVIDNQHHFAVLKIDGNFASLPLAPDYPEADVSPGKVMDAVTVDYTSNGSFTTATLKGKPETMKDQDQTNYFTLLKSELDKETYSNFLSYNALGQATGLALKKDQTSNEKLKFLKSSTILGFLKNKVRNDMFQNSPTKNELTKEELKNRVNQASVTVLIYKE